MSEEQWRGMFAAQCTWDATFAHNALNVLEEHGDPEAVLVVLVGSGHVVYDLGIQRQAAQWSDTPIASVIPIPIRTGDDEPVETVQASYADFIWGLPAETDPLYPYLGVSTRKGKEDDRRSVIYVDEESVAARAGFELGDLILEMDGESIPDKERLAQLMAGKRWGDVARWRSRSPSAASRPRTTRTPTRRRASDSTPLGDGPRRISRSRRGSGSRSRSR
jgi:hypothetical protein